jgi:hypothetical protein
VSKFHLSLRISSLLPNCNYLFIIVDYVARWPLHELTVPFLSLYRPPPSALGFELEFLCHLSLAFSLSPFTFFQRTYYQLKYVISYYKSWWGSKKDLLFLSPTHFPWDPNPLLPFFSFQVESFIFVFLLSDSPSIWYKLLEIKGLSVFSFTVSQD